MIVEIVGRGLRLIVDHISIVYSTAMRDRGQITAYKGERVDARRHNGRFPLEALLRSGNSPIGRLFRRHVGVLSIVVALGLLSAFLEGVGIGILIPLLSFFVAQDLPDATPGFIRAIVSVGDRLLPGSNLVVLGTLIVALFFLKAVFQMANLMLQAKVLERLAHAIRVAVGSKLLIVDYDLLIREDSARLLDVVYSDVWNMTNLFNSLLQMFTAAAAVLTIAILLLVLDWRLALMVGGVGMIALAVFRVLEKRLRLLSATVKASSLAFDAVLQTVIYSERTVRLFGQEAREERRLVDRSATFGDACEAASRQRLLAFPIVELAMVALFLAIFFIGYRLGLSIAFLTAYLVLLSRGQPSVKHLSEAVLDAARYSASTKEVNWLLSLPPKDAETGPREPDFDQAIRFERVSYSYPNGSTGLHDVSFTLRPGSITALIGPSGAGKSTVVNLLARLIEPEQGSIFQGDRPVGEIQSESWRNRIAVAGQDAELVEGTVAENIAYGRPGATEDEIREVARLAHADRFIEGLPAGYATQVGRSGLSLSGGQRQRIGLARALLVRPELLILDEATNAVDGLSEKLILDLLVSHSFFRTALIISHRPTTLAKCEDAIVIEGGKVIETGPISELRYHDSGTK